MLWLQNPRDVSQVTLDSSTVVFHMTLRKCMVCTGGPFQCSVPMQLTHPTQTICFQRTFKGWLCLHLSRLSMHWFLCQEFEAVSCSMHTHHLQYVLVLTHVLCTVATLTVDSCLHHVQARYFHGTDGKDTSDP